MQAATEKAERLHPDVFTAEEAAAYLHLENVATLEWLREKDCLIGHIIGKAYMYHREDLDDCAGRMFDKMDKAVYRPNKRQALKLAGVKP
jgi:hypothetical protein